MAHPSRRDGQSGGVRLLDLVLAGARRSPREGPAQPIKAQRGGSGSRRVVCASLRELPNGDPSCPDLTHLATGCELPGTRAAQARRESTPASPSPVERLVLDGRPDRHRGNASSRAATQSRRTTTLVLGGQELLDRHHRGASPVAPTMSRSGGSPPRHLGESRSPRA